jgi:hypothetical protein
MLALNRSLLNREYDLIYVLKALASTISTCNLHVILLLKILHDSGRGYVPSVQREASLSWSKSVREVDGPSVISINFNVPVITPRLNKTETALQLSEDIALYMIRGIHTSTNVIRKERPDKRLVFWGHHL